MREREWHVCSSVSQAVGILRRRLVEEQAQRSGRKTPDNRKAQAGPKRDSDLLDSPSRLVVQQLRDWAAGFPCLLAGCKWVSDVRRVSGLGAAVERMDVAVPASKSPKVAWSGLGRPGV